MFIIYNLTPTRGIVIVRHFLAYYWFANNATFNYSDTAYPTQAMFILRSKAPFKILGENGRFEYSD